MIGNDINITKIFNVLVLVMIVLYFYKINIAFCSVLKYLLYLCNINHLKRPANRLKSTFERNDITKNKEFTNHFHEMIIYKQFAWLKAYKIRN